MQVISTIYMNCYRTRERVIIIFTIYIKEQNYRKILQIDLRVKKIKMKICKCIF